MPEAALACQVLLPCRCHHLIPTPCLFSCTPPSMACHDAPRAVPPWAWDGFLGSIIPSLRASARDGAAKPVGGPPSLQWARWITAISGCSGCSGCGASECQWMDARALGPGNLAPGEPSSKPAAEHLLSCCWDLTPLPLGTAQMRLAPWRAVGSSSKPLNWLRGAARCSSPKGAPPAPTSVAPSHRPRHIHSQPTTLPTDLGCISWVRHQGTRAKNLAWPCLDVDAAPPPPPDTHPPLRVRPPAPSARETGSQALADSSSSCRLPPHSLRCLTRPK